MLQLLKPACIEPGLCSRRSHSNEKPVHCDAEGSPLLTTTGESPTQQRSNWCSQKQVNIHNKKEDRHSEGREARAIDPVQPGIRITLTKRTDTLTEERRELSSAVMALGLPLHFLEADASDADVGGQSWVSRGYQDLELGL